MIVLDSFDPVPPPWRGAYLAVGNFDGVHLGHVGLIGRLRALAEADGAPALALTFDPPPSAILRPGLQPPPLTWPGRRATLLIDAGAHEVGVFTTGPWLLGLTAREFFDRVVIGQFAARGMIEGPTFGFGRDRGGDAALLGSWCAAAGLAFEIAAPAEVDGRLVSSSEIRARLAEGDAVGAARLLGRPHRVRGIVERGAGRGAGLGFATANLGGVDTQIPADGVYAGLALIDGHGPPRPAAAHVGPNATFGASDRTIEAHLIDYRGDLYGRSIELDLLARLRPTVKFTGVDALVAQMKVDVDQARELLK